MPPANPPAPPGTPPSADEVEARLRALFGNAAAVPNAAAFAALSIQKTLGFELISRGILKRTKIGRASRISVDSIKQVLLNGVPPLPKEDPLPEDDLLPHVVRLARRKRTPKMIGRPTK
jgi:hypothetical protein